MTLSGGVIAAVTLVGRGIRMRMDQEQGSPGPDQAWPEFVASRFAFLPSPVGI